MDEREEEKLEGERKSRRKKKARGKKRSRGSVVMIATTFSLSSPRLSLQGNIGRKRFLSPLMPAGWSS